MRTLFVALFVIFIESAVSRISSVTPQQINSGVSTVLTVTTTELPQSPVCKFSSDYGQSITVAATVASSTEAQCETPVAFFSMETVKVSVVSPQDENFVSNSVPVQFFAFPSCTDALFSSFSEDPIIAVDVDGPGKNIPPFLMECTNIGEEDKNRGFGTLMTSVWNWESTRSLASNWTMSLEHTVGESSLGKAVPSNGEQGAYKLAAKFWPLLSSSGQHMVTLHPRLEGGLTCPAMSWTWNGGQWSVNKTSMKVCMAGPQVLFSRAGGYSHSLCMTKSDTGSTHIPFFYGAGCTVCPAYEGKFGRPPMVFNGALTKIPNLSGVDFSSQCAALGSVLENFQNYYSLTAMVYSAKAWASHSFEPSTISCSVQRTLTISHGTHESPISAKDRIQFVPFETSCFSLTSPNGKVMKKHSVDGQTWVAVFPPSPPGLYKACYQYGGVGPVADFFLAPITAVKDVFDFSDFGSL